MENSHIQWTDHTFNPWIGCTKVSPGCTHCYAEAQNQRWRHGANWGKGAPRSRTSVANWKGPLLWNRKADRIWVCECGFREHYVSDPIPCPRCGGTPHLWHPRVFSASLADWLDHEVPIEWLADLLALIHATLNLNWLLLTKRPENWQKRLAAACIVLDDEVEQWAGNWMLGIEAPTNVWIGTTVEDQPRADERISALLRIPARVRFLSCEPLLSEVVLPQHAICDDGDIEPERPMIHWLICGGESGHGAREMNPDWSRSLRDQCEATGVAFFMKQMGGSRDARGGLAQIPEDLRIRQFPHEQLTAKD